MDRNPLAEVPEPTAVPAERHGNEDSSNDMEIDGTDGKDISEQIMEFSSVNQDDINSGPLKQDNDRVVGDSQITCTENKPKLTWDIFGEENVAFVRAIEMKKNNIEEEEIAEAVEAPPEMLVPLLSHQKEWLGWALRQEESPCRGGILADEVGMGKTIQAIALVLKKRSISRRRSNAGVGTISSSNSSSSSSSPTLVVCPLASLKQWETEIARCTQAGSVKVLVYHGPKRKEKMAPHHDHHQEYLSEYDFVLTTYSIAEVECRKHELLLSNKLVCDFCGKELDRENMKFHGRFLCGRDIIRAAGAGSSTSRNQEPLLTSVTWERIILDEAHVIKSQDSRTTKAILALESTYKWALTGTLLEDSVKESYSLIRFLRVYPYAYFFCWFCNFKSLDSVHPANCPIHGKRFSWWYMFINKPRQYRGLERKRAKTLFTQKVLKSTMLRRTKKRVADDLILPLKIFTIRWHSLDQKEENYYQKLYENAQSKFRSYKDGQGKENYDRITELITPLREALDHLYLVEFSKPGSARICAVCIAVATDRKVTSCGHTFCKACLEDFTKILGKSLCPTCSEPFTMEINSSTGLSAEATGFKTSSILERISLEYFQTSTKIDALREEIRNMVVRDGSAKGIVISQFTSFLDLIRYSLHQSEVNCVIVVGKMTAAAKDDAIKRFNEDPDCRIFLTCLKSGGAALNLPLASNVFMMEPWLNPSIEWQAYDRIYRIGQFKTFRVIKFVIQNSIEEKIVELQWQKESSSEGTPTGKLGKLSTKELKSLLK